jgi:hypothetical protein
MKQRPLLLLTILLLFTAGPARAEEGGSPPAETRQSYLHGRPTEDQLLLGMCTFHAKPSSLRSRNWNQNLLGVQCNDIFACTFENSFSRRAWGLGYVRNLTPFLPVSENWQTCYGYRLGVLYGYKEGQAPLAGLSPVIPMAAFYKRLIYRDHLGIEFTVTNALSINFSYQF